MAHVHHGEGGQRLVEIAGEGHALEFFSHDFWHDQLPNLPAQPGAIGFGPAIEFLVQ